MMRIGCQERAIRAINSDDGLYEANMRGGTQFVIDSHRGYKFHTKSGG
jgi:hypothetical protein